jgi:hypothetical protein
MRLGKGEASNACFLDIETGEILQLPVHVAMPRAGEGVPGGFDSEALSRQPELANWALKTGVDMGFALPKNDWAMAGSAKPGLTVDNNLMTQTTKVFVDSTNSFVYLALHDCREHRSNYEKDRSATPNR